MHHVVLLGDSIFDNGRYVPGRPPIIEQLKSWLPKDWRATLLAVDGAIAEDVSLQLRRLPEEATHLVVSVGGNDALSSSGLLNDVGLTGLELMTELAERQRVFRHEYQSMLTQVLARSHPTVLCNIYDAVPGLPPSALAGLSLFNDVIVRSASARGLPLIDLRSVCTEARDYSEMSPIEPSEIGGSKIVRAIRRTLMRHDFSRGETVIYGAE